MFNNVKKFKTILYLWKKNNIFKKSKELLMKSQQFSIDLESFI